ncbi:hypothetical protein H7J73_29990 [Mycolicibacterium komossense]|uniref:Transmembrane protein n=2 Tax=Mycolicibacterium komossense TaxID=1779 RepID=A0ABT3CLI9_9MYCO|nr:hypothetical protein [Mycolicibacterium komossense]
MPLTEPHWPPIFDTGPHPEPLSAPRPEPEPLPAPELQRDPDHNPWRMPSSTPEPVSWSDELAPEPQLIPAHPIVVAAQYQYLRRWKFALALLGVWVVAAAAGAGLYYWWFQSLDKTWPDTAVLMYVLFCTVAALVISMVQDRPMVSATSIATMTAPFASGLAAAALYGMFAFGLVVP